MRITSILVFALAVLVGACSRSLVGAGGALPQSPRTAMGAVRRPSLPPIPPFQVSARTELGSSAVPIPLPSGFSGTLTPGNRIVKQVSAAMVVGNANPVATMAPNAVPLLFLTVTPGTNVQLGAGTSFVFTLPSEYVVAGTRYYVAAYDPGNPTAGWTLGYTTPAAITGDTLTMTSRISRFLAAGIAYNFALYATYGSPQPPSQQQYTMVGQLVQRYTYAYPTGSPKPPIQSSATVTESFLIGKAKLPPSIGHGSAFRVHVTEADAGALQTSVKSTDAYLTASGGFEGLLGTVSFEFAPWATTYAQTTNTVYPVPLAIAPSPATAGKTWSNSPAATVVQSFSGGQSYQRTIAADGSYSEAGSIPLPSGTPQAVAITECSNGQGVYGYGFRTGEPAYSFAAPTSSPSVIPVSTTAPDQSLSPCVAPRPRPAYTHVPAWFPSPPPGGSPLYAESDASTAATAPKTCGRIAGKAALLISRNIWRLDTIVGYTERTLTRTYLIAGGVGCIVMRDDMNVYYDWLGDVKPRPYLTLSGAPIAAVTTSEFLIGLPSPKGAQIVPPSVAEGAQRQFTARIDRLRTKLILHGGLR